MKVKSSEIFIALCIFFLLFSLYPTGYEIAHRNQLHPDRYFELVHNFPTDYNFYLSRIRQGIEGRKTVIEQYTSEPHSGSFLHYLYLAMGWAGRWSRVPWERGGDVYHVARVVLGFTLLACIAYGARRSFQKFYWQIAAFLLVVTASSWPKLAAVVNNQVVDATLLNISAWRFGGYMPWWSVMDSLQRITFIPHLLLGQILVLIVLFLLSDDRVIVRSGNWIFLGILGFLLGLIFPPGLLFVYVTVGAHVGIEYCIEGRRMNALHRRIWLSQRLGSAGVFFLLSLPSLLYLQLMVSFYPWKRLVQVDQIRPLPFEYVEYVKAVGPILPLGLIGLVAALWQKQKTMFVSAAWVIAWILLLILFQFVPQQSPLRFSEMIPHVPLGILTAYLFYFLMRAEVGISWFSRRQSPDHKSIHTFVSAKAVTALETKRLPARFFLKFLVLALVFLILVGLGQMYSSWLWQKDFVNHKMRATTPLVPTGAYVMYPLKDFLRAMKFIQDNTKRSDIILSETTAGNYIPVYSGNTVFIGHDNTVDLEIKKEIVRNFFSGKMDARSAEDWMKQSNLKYVFYGPQEREDSSGAELDGAYPFLKVINSNQYVTVYSR